MKIAIVTLFMLAALSAQAEDFSHKNLKAVLQIATCELKIVNTPVIFGKDRALALSNKIIFKAHEKTTERRRLKKDRSMKISAVTSKHVIPDDQSVSSICQLDSQKIACAKGMDKLTISQIEDLSGKNVKINCILDPVKDM
jgi:predicted house-cleaning NTP pyrophosphatase (Maf/HAM1 superfamily)